MKTFFSILAISAFWTSLGIAENDILVEQTRIARNISSIPDNNIRFTIYSLDPYSHLGSSVNNSRVFHGFTILGQAEIKESKDIRTILDAFAKGVRESDGGVMACFNPRHGVRVTSRLTTFDFLICFECLSVDAYGFNGNQGFPITASPEKLFNEYCDKFHLPKAKKIDES